MFSPNLAWKQLLGGLLASLSVAIWNPPDSVSLPIEQPSLASGASNLPNTAANDNEGKCVPRAECCKVCSKGKACGNSCIRADYNCHKGAGCACDEADLCD